MEEKKYTIRAIIIFVLFSIISIIGLVLGVLTKDIYLIVSYSLIVPFMLFALVHFLIERHKIKKTNKEKNLC